MLVVQNLAANSPLYKGFLRRPQNRANEPGTPGATAPREEGGAKKGRGEKTATPGFEPTAAPAGAGELNH